MKKTRTVGRYGDYIVVRGDEMVEKFIRNDPSMRLITLWYC